MKNLPHWIQDIIDSNNLTCGRCNQIFYLKDLFSIGIEKSSKNPHKDVLFLGMICKKCGEMTNFELQEMSLIDLAFEVLEEQSSAQTEKKKKELDCELGITAGDQNDSPKKIKEASHNRSKITLKEIKDHSDFLKKIETDDQLLGAMGMSIDEMEKYNIQKKKFK